MVLNRLINVLKLGYLSSVFIGTEDKLSLIVHSYLALKSLCFRGQDVKCNMLDLCTGCRGPSSSLTITYGSLSTLSI